jgi:hypothetical protein
MKQTWEDVIVRMICGSRAQNVLKFARRELKKMRGNRWRAYRGKRDGIGDAGVQESKPADAAKRKPRQSEHPVLSLLLVAFTVNTLFYEYLKVALPQIR